MLGLTLYKIYLNFHLTIFIKHSYLKELGLLYIWKLSNYVVVSLEFNY